MRLRIMTATLSLAALSAAGCATGALDGSGWSGSGAEPFDGARAACEAEAAALAAGQPRTRAFETCMADKGWHRR